MLFKGKSLRSRVLVNGTQHMLKMVLPCHSMVGMFEAHCADYGVVGYGETKAAADKDLQRLLGLSAGDPCGWGKIARKQVPR